jgi:hypothetical protein
VLLAAFIFGWRYRLLSCKQTSEAMSGIAIGAFKAGVAFAASNPSRSHSIRHL